MKHNGPLNYQYIITVYIEAAGLPSMLGQLYFSSVPSQNTYIIFFPIKSIFYALINKLECITSVITIRFRNLKDFEMVCFLSVL